MWQEQVRLITWLVSLTYACASMRSRPSFFSFCLRRVLPLAINRLYIISYRQGTDWEKGRDQTCLLTILLLLLLLLLHSYRFCGCCVVLCSGVWEFFMKSKNSCKVIYFFPSWTLLLSLFLENLCIVQQVINFPLHPSLPACLFGAIFSLGVYRSVHIFLHHILEGGY